MKQNKETLKEYFETGDKPTQQNYHDLIDSFAVTMIGEIKAVSFGAIPQGWAKCDGQLLNPTNYPELFALIGTTYGGDGTTSFALPNLQGRIPLGYGLASELSDYTIGQTGGVETHTLTEDEMPLHSHNAGVKLSTDAAVNETPTAGDVSAVGSVSPVLGTGDPVKSFGSPTNLVDGHESVTTSTGDGQPHNNMQPYLAVNYIIAVEGINPL